VRSRGGAERTARLQDWQLTFRRHFGRISPNEIAQPFELPILFTVPYTLSRSAWKASVTQFTMGGLPFDLMDAELWRWASGRRLLLQDQSRPRPLRSRVLGYGSVATPVVERIVIAQAVRDVAHARLESRGRQPACLPERPGHRIDAVVVTATARSLVRRSSASRLCALLSRCACVTPSEGHK
jgi:hypothetical protein